MRSIAWLWVFAGLAGCSLAGEPKFYRPLPTSDVAVSDGAVVNDGEGPDVVATDGAVADAPREGGPDGGETCVPFGPEVCNDVDDDCDGNVDNVLPLPTPLDCAVPPTSVGMQPRLGVYRGCRCEPAPDRPEICGNGLDENANGSVDEDCTCDAIVVPPTVTGFIDRFLGPIPVYRTVQGALAGVMDDGQRTICLLSANFNCVTRYPHVENIRVPANVTIRGGFTFGSVMVGAPESRPTCRTEIRGTVEFVDSNVNSVVTNVYVKKDFSAVGSAVSMPSDGWFVESTVEAHAPTAPFDIVAIEANGGAPHRVVRNVNVMMDGLADVTGIHASRGRIWVENVRVDIEAGARSVAIDLDQIAPSVLNNINVATLIGSELTEAVHVTEPQSYMAINALNGSAGRSSVGRGLTIECPRDSAAVVQVRDTNWGGSLAPESVGALVQGCHAEFSAVMRESAIASSSSTNEGAGGSEAVALRCERGARCVALGGRKLEFLSLSSASSGSVGTTRGAAIIDGASALAVGATFSGRGSINSSTGFEMDGRFLLASHSTFIAGASTSADGARALQIKQAVAAGVTTSVLRAAHGIGASIEAGAVGELVFLSNTVTAVNSDPNMAPTQLVVIRGARSPGSIRFENNLLACSNLPMSPPIAVSTTGLQIDGTSPFDYFGYNMIGGCQKPVVMADQSIFDAPTAQRRLWMNLAAGAGPLQIPATTLAIDPGTGWRLTASSPAVGQGSPAVLAAEVRDFRGALRGPLAPADIGAHEL